MKILHKLSMKANIATHSLISSTKTVVSSYKNDPTFRSNVNMMGIAFIYGAATSHNYHTRKARKAAKNKA
jgi:hypothetical protein